MQTRICDCWLDVGQCSCEIIKTQNERKQINSNGESTKERDRGAVSNPKPDKQPKRPLDWDARDLKTYEGLPRSGRSTEGRYTNRFWEDED